MRLDIAMPVSFEFADVMVKKLNNGERYGQWEEEVHHELGDSRTLVCRPCSDTLRMITAKERVVERRAATAVAYPVNEAGWWPTKVETVLVTTDPHGHFQKGHCRCSSVSIVQLYAIAVGRWTYSVRTVWTGPNQEEAIRLQQQPLSEQYELRLSVDCGSVDPADAVRRGKGRLRALLASVCRVDVSLTDAVRACARGDGPGGSGAGGPGAGAAGLHDPAAAAPCGAGAGRDTLPPGGGQDAAGSGQAGAPASPA